MTVVSSIDAPNTVVVPRKVVSEWDGSDTTAQDSLTWLSALAMRAGDTETATLLPFLYGTATCPSCKAEFDLLERLADAE